MSGHLLFVMNSAKYFLLNRLPLAEAARKSGYRVSLAAPADDVESVQRIESAGVTFYEWSLVRKGLAPFSTAKSLLSLRKILKRANPSLVHSLTIKSVILSGIACRMSGIPMVTLVPGRGVAFDSKLLAPIARLLYAVALSDRSTQVCFQNREDRQFFIEKGILLPQQTALIPGSGVNTTKFRYHPYRQSSPSRVVAMGARMLREKGVYEFLEAARQLRGQGLTFQLAGAPDPDNPHSIDLSELLELCKASDVAYLGHIEDMPAFLSSVDIFCLPTYYPEGIPMTLLQAASMGKALITTDVPGCREVVTDRETGLLIPPRDPIALAKAISTLASQPGLCGSLSKNSRKQLEKRFTDTIIHAKTLELYQLRLSS